MNSFDDYQAKAHLTAAVKQGGRIEKVWASMEFASEWMELGAVILSNSTKAQFRPKQKTDSEFVEKMADELGDALWTLASLANAYGLRLSVVAENNLRKVSKKHEGLKEAGHDGSTDVSVVEGVRGISGATGGGKKAEAGKSSGACNINDKKRTTCKDCESKNLHVVSGCPTCQDCGWSPCS